MRKTFVVSLCVLFALSLLAVGAYAKDTQNKMLQYNFTESPQEVLNAPEIGGSMFQAAAANTVILGWWQFDNANGTPNAQGWTEYDITTQPKKYWHVAGTPVGCDAIVPIAGTKSLWCGQWTTTAPPWCGWVALPGYGNGWDQSWVSTVNVTTIAFQIRWDSEPGYDYTYVEYFDAGVPGWVADPLANAGAGGYTGSGTLTETGLTNTFANSKARIHFVSDGAWSDEDGLWPTVQGGVTIDNLSINGGAAQTFETAACGAQTVGSFTAAYPPGFGEFGTLYLGTSVVQVDPCLKPLSNMWGWFDAPTITNYACGGWPLQGAVRYGPDANGLYMDNEIWSPVQAINGTGSEYILQLLSYRDLNLSALIFYVWHVRSQIGVTGCPTGWSDFNFVYYGGQKDWIRTQFQVGTFIPAGATHMQVAVGAVDMCGPWGGINGDCQCHAHAPLIDQVKLMHVETFGPQYTQRDIDIWHDNFPELGGVSATSYARCDMAQDIILSSKKNLVPGDSLKIVITDPVGLAPDNTGGRPGDAAYVFVKCTDRFGANIGYTGAQMASPDNKAYATDPRVGLRWPYVAGLAPEAQNWYAFRLDSAFTAVGGIVKDTYCGDLMDLAAGPDGPPYHPNELGIGSNVGRFKPGDVIWYFFAAKNTLNQWAYLGRDYNGQGAWVRGNNISDFIGVDTNGLPKIALEWSVLPDRGRLAGEQGDVLFVDDADDRGGPAQLYFDNAFAKLGFTNRVDRFDVLGPSSTVGNSLAGRVKSIQNQMMGNTLESPEQVYQKVLWNCSDLSRGLMGDGGSPNGGSSPEKSDDFALANTFLTQSLDAPGWAYWGDDVVQDWASLVGLGAVAVKGSYMNFALPLNGDDQRKTTGVTSPQILPQSPAPPLGYLDATESFYAYGGCAVINDFDVPNPFGLSQVAHRYVSGTTGLPAALSQFTPTSTDTARFYLAGFAFNYIRDDTANLNPGSPDYADHLEEIILWFQNQLGTPTGLDPVAFANSLEGNYPNPFNPTTTIKYSIAERGRVTLKIYNAAGQLVRTLMDEEQAPQATGFSKVWNGMNDHGQPVASGVYFYQLTAKNFSQTKKMVLLK